MTIRDAQSHANFVHKACELKSMSQWHLQVKLLKEKFKAALPEEVMRMVDINTIDGFQVRLPASSVIWSI